MLQHLGADPAGHAATANTCRTLPQERFVSLPQFDIVSSSFHADPSRTLEQLRATDHPLVRMRQPIRLTVLNLK